MGAWDYHSGLELLENEEKKPLRIFTHVSENDNRKDEPAETHHNFMIADKRIVSALEAKGYDYRNVYSLATRHCDKKVFEQTLGETLIWTWRGYKGE